MSILNLTNIVASFALSSMLSLFLTPAMLLLAKKYKITDSPNHRKLHKEDTPLLGGFAIYIAFVVTVAIFAYHGEPLVKMAVIVAATMIEILALIDDIKNISAKVRFAIMILLSAAIFITFYFSYFSWTFLHESIWASIAMGLVVIVWITAIINAFNFTDGIDGLSSYFSLIALFAFSIILSMQGRYEFAIIVNIAAIGGVIGFIPYNRHKALIFMGDAGSMLLGFIISIIALVTLTKVDTVMYAIVPIYILLVPLMELGTSVLRRLIFKKSLFTADKYHFHHLLKNVVDDSLLVVVLLATIQVIFAFFGVMIYIYELYIIGTVMLVIVVVTATIALCIKYRKIKDELEEEKYD